MRIRKNGKVVNLTESDLRRIVKRVLNERESPNSFSVSVSKKGAEGKLELSDVSVQRKKYGNGSKCFLSFDYKVIEGENELFKKHLNKLPMEGYGEYLCEHLSEKDGKPLQSTTNHPIPHFTVKPSYGESWEYSLEVESNILSNWCSKCSNQKVGANSGGVSF